MRLKDGWVISRSEIEREAYETFEEDDLTYVSCKAIGGAHFYIKLEDSYSCKYCGKTKKIKDVIDELESQRGD